MIAQICGKIVQEGINSVLIDVNGIVYEVLVPALIMQRLKESINPDGQIRLVTYHYLQVEPSKSKPVLVGFLNEIEKDFFEEFITVSGIGPRAALKAINQPISRIAQAIDEADANFLCSLPGIGRQRAKEIIAKLQTKAGKFGLIKDTDTKVISPKEDLLNEALEVLLKLQYSKKEAQAMIDKAISHAPGINSVEDLLNEIYKQTRT